MNRHDVMKIAGMIGCLAASRLAYSQTAGTVFTYQGELMQSGQDVDATIPMSFRLFDAAVGGTQVGSTVTMGGVDVVDGLFQVGLDFGAVATGTTGLWLEIQVDGFVMSPREAITASPYSLQTRGIHVNSAGDVGIGTDAPDADFEVREDDASIRVRSTNGVNTARVELMGTLPSPAGGVFSSLRFLDSLGGARFGIQHDSAFFTEYLTLTTPDHPNGLVRIREDGLISIDDLPSIATVHVTDRDIGVYNDGMLNETLALEDNDAVLGIYSSNTGSFGSALVFGESTGNALNDKWGMVRTTTNTSAQLRVTYGSNPNYAQNPIALTFVPGGVQFADGSVQRYSGAVDSYGASQVANINISSSGLLPDPAVVTITDSAQSILVNVFAYGQHGADGQSSVHCRVAYRAFGSPSTPIGVTEPISFFEDNTGSVNVFERFSYGSTALITGLAPGTYEVGAYMVSLGNATIPPTYRHSDISAIVY